MQARSQTPMTPSQSTATRTPSSVAKAYAPSALILAASYAFFAAMARFEPITGDGWGVADDLHRNGAGLLKLLHRMYRYTSAGTRGSDSCSRS